MNKPSKIIRLAAAALAFGLLVLAPAMAAPTAADGSANAQFKRIYTAEWAWRTGHPGSADAAAGDTGRLDDVGAASQQRRLDYWQRVMKQLDAIDVAQLTSANRVNFEVYHAQIGNLLADQKFKTWQMPFNSDSAFWSDIGYELGGNRLRSVDDYRRYLDRLGQIPAYFDQQIANMRLGLKRGFSVPREVLSGRDVSIAAVAELKDPTQSSFYKPFKQLPSTISADQAQALQGQALQHIRDDVIPAYAKLLKFFRDDYVPHARTTLAAEAMPDGKAYYRQQIREYTTLDLGPDQIHQIGLEQVAKIHARMLEVMKETGFKGGFPAFLAFLRSDPQFYAKTPQELLDKSAWVAKEVDGKMAKFFGHLPRARFTIVP
ncbi:DUF885 domain-containing protein, partial [Rhodanobacter lindaniclasticus]